VRVEGVVIEVIPPSKLNSSKIRLILGIEAKSGLAASKD